MQANQYLSRLTKHKSSSGKSKSNSVSLPPGAVHCRVEAPDLIPDPGIFQALGSQHAFDLLKIGSVIANLSDNKMGRFV